MSATQTITTTIRRKKPTVQATQQEKPTVKSAYKRKVQASKRRVCPTCGRPL